jgi:hypothetical protein
MRYLLFCFILMPLLENKSSQVAFRIRGAILF